MCVCILFLVCSMHTFRSVFIVMHVHLRIVLWTGRLKKKKNASTSFKNEDKLTETVRNEKKATRLEQRKEEKNDSTRSTPDEVISRQSSHMESSIELMGWKECVYEYWHRYLYVANEWWHFSFNYFWPIPGKGRRSDAPHRCESWIEQKKKRTHSAIAVNQRLSV